MKDGSIIARLEALQAQDWTGSDEEIVQWAEKLADANNRDDDEALELAIEALTLSIEARRSPGQATS
jgi:hypothetical protein